MKWGIAIMVVAFITMTVAFVIVLAKYINMKKEKENEIQPVKS